MPPSSGLRSYEIGGEARSLPVFALNNGDVRRLHGGQLKVFTSYQPITYLGVDSEVVNQHVQGRHRPASRRAATGWHHCRLIPPRNRPNVSKVIDFLVMRVECFISVHSRIKSGALDET